MLKVREDVLQRLQNVCLIDRDQRPMQRVSAEQGRSRLAQMAGVRAMGQERARRAHPHLTSWSKASQNPMLEVPMVWQQDGLAVLGKELSLSEQTEVQDPSNSHAAGEAAHLRMCQGCSSRQRLTWRRRLRRCQNMLKHAQRLGESKDVCPLRASVRTLND